MLTKEKKELLWYSLWSFEEYGTYSFAQWLVDNLFVLKTVTCGPYKDDVNIPQDQFLAGYLLRKGDNVDWYERIRYYAHELAKTPIRISPITPDFYEAYISFMKQNYYLRTLPPFIMLAIGKVLSLFKYAIVRPQLIVKKISFSEQSNSVKTPGVNNMFIVPVDVGGVIVVDLEKYANYVLYMAIDLLEHLDNKYFRISSKSKRMELACDGNFIEKALNFLYELTCNGHVYAYNGPIFRFSNSGFSRIVPKDCIMPAPSGAPALGVFSAIDCANYNRLADYLSEHVCHKNNRKKHGDYYVAHSEQYDLIARDFNTESYRFSFIEQYVKSVENEDENFLRHHVVWRALFGKILISTEFAFFNHDDFLHNFEYFLPYLKYFLVNEERLIGRKVNNCLAISINDVYSLVLESLVRRGGWVRMTCR